MNVFKLIVSFVSLTLALSEHNLPAACIQHTLKFVGEVKKCFSFPFNSKLENSRRRTMHEHVLGVNIQKIFLHVCILFINTILNRVPTLKNLAATIITFSIEARIYLYTAVVK
jgi:predicted nuclease of restriction endonuclease-like (RecB) superfamily